MPIFRALRAVVVSVATCAGLMLLFAFASQVQRGRWSLGDLGDFVVPLTWPFLIALGFIGLPAFAILSRLTALLEPPPVAMAAGAALLAPPALIVAASYLSQSVEAPQSIGAWIGYFRDNPGSLVGWLAPYALSGAVFGYLWATWQDTRVVRSEP